MAQGKIAFAGWVDVVTPDFLVQGLVVGLTLARMA